jgi:hypothetical protein
MTGKTHENAARDGLNLFGVEFMLGTGHGGSRRQFLDTGPMN